jgi:hypothetical protein
VSDGWDTARGEEGECCGCCLQRAGQWRCDDEADFLRYRKGLETLREGRALGDEPVICEGWVVDCEVP